MSAWEYWSKAEALMAEYQFLDAGELADELSEAGYILPADREKVAAELTRHDVAYGREDDDDLDCKCGKWLEPDQYEWPDHVGSVLNQWITEAGRADSRAMPRSNAPRPLAVEVPASELPDEMRWPQRTMGEINAQP